MEWYYCEHNEIRYATSADWQDVCVDCGAVLRDYAEGDSDGSTKSDEATK